jgi:hypothetical protein
MVHDVRVPIVDVGASRNRACATYPTVAMGKLRLLLLGHHNSDRTVVVGHLPIATEGYGLLLQRHIVVVFIAQEEGSLSRKSKCKVVSMFF